MKNEITFNGTSILNWIDAICNWQPDSEDDKSLVDICFKEIDNPNRFDPFHVVLLACYMQHIYDLDYETCMVHGSDEIGKFWVNDIKLPRYWESNQPKYIESETETIFNLWHAKDAEMEMYSDHVHKYLKRKFFKEKDLSAVKNSLLEIYYNIFDHAGANGNNFSFMKYNIQEARLYVAVCDFGKGIAKSIREKFTTIESDEEALLYAIKPMVTTQSRTHNKGMGLSNIIDHISNGDTLRIVSNGAILFRDSDQTKTIKLANDFCGTMIYYDISLNNFENEETYSIFDLDFDFGF